MADNPEVSSPTAANVHFSRPSGKCHGRHIFKAIFARGRHCQSKSHPQKQRKSRRETALGINSGRITLRKVRWNQSEEWMTSSLCDQIPEAPAPNSARPQYETARSKNVRRGCAVACKRLLAADVTTHCPTVWK